MSQMGSSPSKDPQDENQSPEQWQPLPPMAARLWYLILAGLLIVFLGQIWTDYRQVSKIP